MQRGLKGRGGFFTNIINNNIIVEMALLCNTAKRQAAKYKGIASSALRNTRTDEGHLKYTLKCESAHFTRSAFLSLLACSGFSSNLHFRKYYTTQHCDCGAKNSHLTWSSWLKKGFKDYRKYIFLIALLSCSVLEL